MPAPDPHGLWFERPSPGTLTIRYMGFYHGDFPLPYRRSGDREGRAAAVIDRLRRGNWCCPWCGEQLPAHKMADAQYCREGCRKAAARLRRR